MKALQYDEYNVKVFFKSGKDNMIADALSTQYMSKMRDNSTFIIDAGEVHRELFFTNAIVSVDRQVNCFRNQIIVN